MPIPVSAETPATRGDPKSTDPDRLICQAYTQSEKSGGFLMVTVHPAETNGKTATAEFSFFDENGKQLYSAKKQHNK